MKSAGVYMTSARVEGARHSRQNVLTNEPPSTTNTLPVI
jgi:hypothetical protein